MEPESFLDDKTKHIEKLADEIADLKGILQDISQQVRRIERRVDLVLPEVQRKKSEKASKGGDSRTVKAHKMSEVEAHQTIEKLKQSLYKNKSIQSELRNMTVKHGLTPIARVLGMTNTALPPKAELILNIITRLRQSVMLTENIRKVPRVAEEEKHFGG